MDSTTGLISFEINGNIKRDIIFLSNMYYLEKKHIWSHCRKMGEKINDDFFHLEFLGISMNGVKKKQAYDKKQHIASYWDFYIKECKLYISHSIASGSSDAKTSCMLHICFTFYILLKLWAQEISQNRRKEQCSKISIVLCWLDLHSIKAIQTNMYCSSVFKGNKR